MLWVKESIDEIVKKLGSNEDKGLDDASILEKQKKYGANEFEEGKKETTLEKVGHHLAEITTIILLVAAAISAYLALTTGYGWAKVIVILAIVVLNIVLGIYQENSAEKALDALKNMNAHLTTV
ncbi:MAG: cation-transporting P-type ATPase, partial [Carnobacterium sp.]